MRHSLLLWITLVPASGLCADVCQDINASTAPSCPKNGNTMLNETFPALGYVISTDPHGQGRYFTAEAAEKVFRADPQAAIFMPMKESEFQQLLTDLKQRNMSNEELRRFISRVRLLGGGSYVWQQDNFESFINPQTGQPVLRQIRDTTRGSRFDEMSRDANSSCSLVGIGESLPPASETNYTHTAAAAGGNIEGLPGNLCLHSSSQRFDNFGKYYCGSNDNSVAIDTSWLRVGHVDEVFATVRNPNGRPPCNFAFEVASPRKAMELLGANSAEGFVNASSIQNADPTMSNYVAANKRWDYGPMAEICRSSNQALQSPEHDNQDPVVPAAQRAASLWNLINIPNAYGANVSTVGCIDLNNGQVLAGIKKNPRLLELNLEIQARMDEAKESIRARIHRALPGCRPEFIDVPNLFNSETPNKRDANGRLDISNAQADSILPNPTNHLAVGNTIISSDPQNRTFRKYLDSVYTHLGLRHQTVDTWKVAHVANGNIHCATHTIRYCSPKRTKSDDR